MSHSTSLDPAVLPAATRGLDLPVPSLELDFTLSATLSEKIAVGKTLGGHKNWIGITGGHWKARWGSGTIVNGGQDYQSVTESLATKVETQYLLKTADPTPAYIAVRTNGWRTGTPEVLQKLFDPVAANSVQPSEYSFRLYIHLETGDERYGFLNSCMWVASGARLGAEVIYNAYRVL